MEHNEEAYKDIENLLHEVLENQDNLQTTLQVVHEKVLLLESQLGLDAPTDEYALETAVDELYDRACARAETGIHVSVPYLIRELQTTAAVAHELMERLRIDGLLNNASTEGGEDDDDTDVFTTIDLRDVNNPDEAAVAAEPVEAAVYDAARSFVVQEQKCSQAALMKALGVNQSVARSLLHELEEAGVVSAAKGRKGRTVLVTE